ncbi:MAG: PD-(D/E)XK motif protein [Pseudomonas sp.]|nr:PD-(D/E)XK motif protein [Pseudomonas sp.]
MANTLDSRWDLLNSDHIHSVFQLYDADHPLDFYIGKSVKQQRLLLLVTPQEPPSIRDMRAICIQSFRRDDGKWSFLLTLDSTDLAPVFSLLCVDLIETSRNKGKPADRSLNVVLKRLSNWRKLFEHGLPDLLSENEVRGLCGELLFLLRLCEQLGAAASVKAWVGPKRADQDFQSLDTAWEVKTIRPSADKINISSEAQLQATTRAIYLVIFELADSLEGVVDAFSLNILVEKVRARLAEDHDVGELFEEGLVAAGYVARPEYGVQILIERSLSIFSVKLGFPCITGEMLAPGVNRVSYEILLSACEKFRIDSSSLLERRGK